MGDTWINAMSMNLEKSGLGILPATLTQHLKESRMSASRVRKEDFMEMSGRVLREWDVRHRLIFWRALFSGVNGAVLGGAKGEEAPSQEYRQAFDTHSLCEISLCY